MAIYNLDGTDKEISVQGRYASVKNNGTETVYASSTPDLDLEAAEVVPIQAGESVVVRDCKKKLYVRGSGQIAVVSANMLYNFFSSPPKNGGEGGGITNQQLDEKLKEYVPITGGSVEGNLRVSDGKALALSPRSAEQAELDEAPGNQYGKIYSDTEGRIKIFDRWFLSDQSAYQAVKIIIDRSTVNVQFGLFDKDGNYIPLYDGDELVQVTIDANKLYPSRSGRMSLGTPDKSWASGFIDNLTIKYINMDNPPWASPAAVPNLGTHPGLTDPNIKFSSLEQITKSGWYSFAYVDSTFVNGNITTGATLPIKNNSYYNVLASADRLINGYMYAGTLQVTSPGVDTSIYMGFVSGGKITAWVNLSDVSASLSSEDYVHASGQLSASLVNTVNNPYNYEGFCISSLNIGIPEEYATGTYYFIKYISRDNIGAIQFAFDMNNHGWFFYRSSNRSTTNRQWNPWIKLSAGEAAVST